MYIYILYAKQGATSAKGQGAKYFNYSHLFFVINLSLYALKIMIDPSLHSSCATKIICMATNERWRLRLPVLKNFSSTLYRNYFVNNYNPDVPCTWYRVCPCCQCESIPAAKFWNNPFSAYPCFFFSRQFHKLVLSFNVLLSLALYMYFRLLLISISNALDIVKLLLLLLLLIPEKFCREILFSKLQSMEYRIGHHPAAAIYIIVSILCPWQ